MRTSAPVGHCSWLGITHGISCETLLSVCSTTCPLSSPPDDCTGAPLLSSRENHAYRNAPAGSLMSAQPDSAPLQETCPLLFTWHVARESGLPLGHRGYVTVVMMLLPATAGACF